jgi:dihydrodipicolinate synthase/N-acetylneuraminate lyase
LRTGAISQEELARSVVAVPPLARRADLSLDPEANRALIRHLEAGGVTTLLYGGNANFYHLGSGRFEETLDLLEEAAGPETLVIPSVGPAYGVMMDQAAVLRRRRFPAAMVLPEHFAATPEGVEMGVRRFVESSGRPAVLYLKQETMIAPSGVERLWRDGLLAAVKYAVSRKDPAGDPYLRRLVEAVEPGRIVSGMGEQPAPVHLRDFGLGGFTSGLVSIAPRRSSQLLRALKAGRFEEAERIREAFRPAEELRNALGPIRVLHDAVTLAGIAGMGPLLPLLTNLEEVHRPRVREAALRLLAYEREAAPEGG